MFEIAGVDCTMKTCTNYHYAEDRSDIGYKKCKVKLVIVDICS